jgi:hypothetical protein
MSAFDIADFSILNANPSKPTRKLRGIFKYGAGRLIAGFRRVEGVRLGHLQMVVDAAVRIGLVSQVLCL